MGSGELRGSQQSHWGLINGTLNCIRAIGREMPGRERKQIRRESRASEPYGSGEPGTLSRSLGTVCPQEGSGWVARMPGSQEGPQTLPFQQRCERASPSSLSQEGASVLEATCCEGYFPSQRGRQPSLEQSRPGRNTLHAVRAPTASKHQKAAGHLQPRVLEPNQPRGQG